MGRDGAEGATAKTAAMEAYGELDHLVGRDALAFVFGMRQSGVGEVERVVELVLGKWLIGGINDEVVRR